jgi:hypothetical protein
MALGLPQPTFTQLGLPSRALLSTAYPDSLPVAGGTLPVATTPTVKADAHGKAKDGGRVMVEVDGAGTVTLRVWSPSSGAWRYPSSSSGSYQKTFAAAGMDYFDVPPGSLFHLTVDAGTVKCWIDADPPTGY